jgi:hypothetical protein
MGTETIIGLCFGVAALVGILLGAIVMRKCIVASWWVAFAVFVGLFFALVGAVIGVAIWLVLFFDASGEGSRPAFLTFSFAGTFLGSFIGSAKEFEWVLTRVQQGKKIAEVTHAD